MSDSNVGRSPQQRLIALGGLAAIVGVAVLLLWAGGILGNQGGGEGIEDVLVLDTQPAEGGGELQVGTQKGQLAPDFEISDFDGSRHTLSDFRGQVVYVNFWATWCGPCRKEMPQFVAAYEAHRDEGLVVIGLNLQESESIIRPFTEDFGIDFPVLIDRDGEVGDDYRLLGLPATYFIGRDGVIESAFIGPFEAEERGTNVQGAIEQSELEVRIAAILGSGEGDGGG